MVLKSGTDPSRRQRSKEEKGFKVIVFAADGKQFTNGYAQKLLRRSRDIILIAGHYEGVDERVVKALKAEKDFYRFICALRRGIARDGCRRRYRAPHSRRVG